MADFKYKNKQQVSRQEAGEWLRAVADALLTGGSVNLGTDGEEATVRVPHHVLLEREYEAKRDRAELEIELKWATAEQAASDTNDETEQVADAPVSAAATPAADSPGLQIEATAAADAPATVATPEAPAAPVASAPPVVDAVATPVPEAPAAPAAAAPPVVEAAASAAAASFEAAD